MELGQVDITVEASMMASCMALPREGHLDELYHMFAYLKFKHNLEMVFDPTYPDIDETLFPRENWKHTLSSQEKIGSIQYMVIVKKSSQQMP